MRRCWRPSTPILNTPETAPEKPTRVNITARPFGDHAAAKSEILPQDVANVGLDRSGAATASATAVAETASSATTALTTTRTVTARGYEAVRRFENLCNA